MAEGKPAVFDRIILKYPDLKMLLEYARSDVVPAIPSGKEATNPNVRSSYDNSTLPSHGKSWSVDPMANQNTALG